MNPIIFLILLSFLMSLFIGKYLIQVLKRNRINQRLSIYLEDAHENKKDTELRPCAGHARRDAPRHETDR